MVALLGTDHYTANSKHTDATQTSTTSLPLPLTIFCPWAYPPVYIGIYRRSPVVRFVGGGSYIVYIYI